MKFKKIYIEITNACNFACSFCFKSNRKKTFISPKDFSAILFSIRPYTDYIYLHVLGEPLLHPDLDELLSMAEEKGFHVNLTTNGSLLLKRKEILVRHSIRQYNVSLHDAEENLPKEQWETYWFEVVNFAKEFSDKSYFSFRLWNQGSSSSELYNAMCIEFLEKSFGVKILEQGRNVKLSDHIFLQRSGRFSWPGEKELGREEKTCYALKDHVAILVDGTVVPCCLDADGSMALGNIHEDSLEKIVKRERALRIKEGFQRHQAVEHVCKDCGFMLP